MTGTGSAGHSRAEAAAGWLRAHLGQQGGQAGAGAVLPAALAAGHAPRTVRRAAIALGVVMARRGQGTTWTLLPEQGQPEPEQGQGSGKRGHSAAKGGRQSGHASATAPPEAEPVAEPGRPATRRVLSRAARPGEPAEYVQVAGAAACSHWNAAAWHRVGEQ